MVNFELAAENSIGVSCRFTKALGLFDELPVVEVVVEVPVEDEAFVDVEVEVPELVVVDVVEAVAGRIPAIRLVFMPSGSTRIPLILSNPEVVVGVELAPVVEPVTPVLVQPENPNAQQNARMTITRRFFNIGLPLITYRFFF
jgi:hypothetical protein